MKFLKTYLTVFVLLCIFIFCGGAMLFDFNGHLLLPLLTISLIFSVLVYIIIRLDSRIDALEKRLHSLEEQDSQGE